VTPEGRVLTVQPEKLAFVMEVTAGVPLVVTVNDPTAPDATDVEVTLVIEGELWTVRVKELVDALTPAASVTFTTMLLKVPLTVGVPVMPLELIESPVGNADPAEVYVPGVLPTVLVIGRV
jgi:hypothetical protein